MTSEQIHTARARAQEIFTYAEVVLTAKESDQIEIADFGLNNLEEEGLEIVTYVNNDRYCAKELALFPRQSCPEHCHPPVGNDPGKTETFRVRAGVVYLYVEGPRTSRIKAMIPKSSSGYYTVFHEIELHPGQQYTIPCNTLHWFQAGDTPAVVSEFSSPSRDEFDMFTDPRVRRVADGK